VASPETFGYTLVRVNFNQTYEFFKLVLREQRSTQWMYCIV